jgi:hypothetical protein
MRHKEELELDLQQIAEIWRFGSVVRSWLLDLTAEALAENPELESIAAWVSDSGVTTGPGTPRAAWRTPQSTVSKKLRHRASRLPKSALGSLARARGTRGPESGENTPRADLVPPMSPASNMDRPQQLLPAAYSKLTESEM